MKYFCFGNMFHLVFVCFVMYGLIYFVFFKSFANLGTVVLRHTYIRHTRNAYTTRVYIYIHTILVKN